MKIRQRRPCRHAPFDGAQDKPVGCAPLGDASDFALRATTGQALLHAPFDCAQDKPFDGAQDKWVIFLFYQNTNPSDRVV